MHKLNSAAARLARLQSPSAGQISGGTAAAVGLTFIVLLLLALGLLIAPPLVIALLWFPALGLTGWAHFWATVAVFVVWWVLVRLVNNSRK